MDDSKHTGELIAKIQKCNNNTVKIAELIADEVLQVLESIKEDLALKNWQKWNNIKEYLKD